MKSSLATYEYVKEIDDGPMPSPHKAAVLHTAVSNATDLHDYWQSGQAGSGVGAHFYINQSGAIFQYLDSVRKTGHAFAANDFAVGIETWDGGDSTIKWNDAQVEAIVALLRDLGIPAQALKENPSDGVGFHREYASWNLNSHTCPGDARAKQVAEVIIPKLSEGGDDLSDVKDALEKHGLSLDDLAGSVARDLGKRLEEKTPGKATVPARIIGGSVSDVQAGIDAERAAKP